MKKLIIALLALCSVVHGQQLVVFKNFQLPVTNIAATTTNSSLGPIVVLDQSKAAARIYLTASGTAATTNGSLIVKFSTAGGTQNITNEFDTGSLSGVKLTMTGTTGIALTTNTVSDWFNLTGVRYIRVGQIENGFLGTISNMQMRICYPDP